MSRRKAPLREQSFLIVSIASGLVLGLVVAFVIPLITGGNDGESGGAIAIGVVVAIVVSIGGIFLGLFIGRRIVGDRIEVAVREPGRKWRHGRVTVSPGHLSFQPYLWQVRIPRGPAEDIPVERLGDDTGRRTGWKQMWSVNPQLHIIDVERPGGVLELASLPSRLVELRERLDRGSEQRSTPAA